MFFESHAHYDDPRFDEDREELLASFQRNSVDYVINVGADMESSEASVKLAEDYDFIYAAAGVHPHAANTLNEDNLKKLEDICSNPTVVAYGEIGLDFHYDHSPRDVQRYWFARQLELAERLDLPVIIHSREAAAETFDIIKSSNVRKGVIHCYSGSAPMALDYIEMGFYIGVGGVITFKKTRKLREVVEAIPLERVLLETDAPYLAPVPHRGQRNNSNYLIFVATKIAEIKGNSTQNVAKITFANAREVFSLDSKRKPNEIIKKKRHISDIINK
ncbi:MAG: TatD family hydrolase [Clostridiales bacterium]|jgi:TatD DNase family protein|nr:TatD family hydrolase [Clostridiales bacterium]